MLPSEWQGCIVAIGRTVRDLRRQLGWSQQTLANYAITSQGAVSRLEAGGAGDVPLRSVVIQLRALATGAEEIELPLSPAARALVAFSRAFTPTFTLTQPVDPELRQCLALFHRLPPDRRKAALRLLEAAVDLFGQPVLDSAGDMAHG